MEHQDPAGRVRAARAYAGLGQQELADKTRIGLATLRRIESGVRRPTIEETWVIADACRLPRSWFTADLSRLDEIASSPPRTPAEQLRQFQLALEKLNRDFQVMLAQSRQQN